MLSERVQEALGQLVGAGLLALSVAVGLGVMTELMEEEVEDVAGPKGKHNPKRTADGESEVPVQTYQHFADRDPLAWVVLERMLAGVSTRRYERTQEPVGEDVETEARSARKARCPGRSWRAPAKRSAS